MLIQKQRLKTNEPADNLLNLFLGFLSPAQDPELDGGGGGTR